MRIRNRSILFFILLLISGTLYAQDDFSRDVTDKKPDKDKKKKEEPDRKFLWGGGIGAQFGNPTYIELSPKFGYLVTPRLMLGAGISYIYYWEDLSAYGVQDKYETSIYGGTIYSKFEIIEGLFAHIEFEGLNFEYYNNDPGEFKRKWVGSFFVGGGYRQRISDNGFMEIMILYNLNYNSLSPYSSPWVPRISIFL